ncbi:recombinase family protein [Rhodococcus sp. BH5]|uniref:recombinase family protein n=1 Tax=Rhodococcus sp. BH5 TaxID=2871702 RepID=UPI003FA7A058
MRAFIYCRISADREGAGLGVERQRKDCEQLAETLGWTIAGTFTDNDLSAYSGKPRPAYNEMLESVEAGQAGAIIAWHTDRLHRSPAELETFISLCDRASVVVRTVQAGELDLSTPAGQMTARIVGAVARHEIDHARKRMVAAHAQAAEKGRAHGKIPFGYAAVRDDSGAIVSRVPDPAEAGLVREAVARILGGEATRAVTQDWAGRGVLTRSGGVWNPRSLREMLMRPTLAGLRAHRGSVSRGEWEPIISEGEHVRLVALYSDPLRRTNRGTGVRHLMSGIALCGLCGSGVQRLKSGGYPAYACAGCTRVSRSVRLVDDLVGRAVVRRCNLPDAQRAFDPAPPDAEKFESELRDLQLRLATAADMLADGDMDRAGYLRVRDRVSPRISELKKLAQPNESDGSLARMIRSPDKEEYWNSPGLPVSEKRTIIRELLDGVIILPAKAVAARDQCLWWVWRSA